MRSEKIDNFDNIDNFSDPVKMEGSTGTLATLQQNHYYPFGML